MDKSWVRLDRRSPEYYAGLKVFLDGAPKSVPDNKIVCPGVKCKNRDSFDRRTVEQHLVVKGMWAFYMNTRWKEHGESYDQYRDHMELQNDGGAEINGMQEFLNEAFMQPAIGENVGSSSEPHIFDGPTPEAEKFYKLLEDANKELYPGCKFKKLEAVVRLYQLKCLGGLSDNIFSKLLEFIKELLPEGECLPDSFYQTKKLVNELSLTYEKIDACPNDCMLFWTTKADLKTCTECGASRYIEQDSENAGKEVPAKVLRHFPLKPRLQRLYMSKHTAEHMRWHATECPKDGLMRHPSDSPAWKHLDLLYPEFGSESRNVRLGLASDGFNPYGNMSTAHSTWPVVISVYNLPPWMCMKQSNLFLSLLIPGPQGPGNDIHVYLEPLIDELKELWEDGVTTYDVSSNERFIMKAALLWIIHDFPAYGNLSGWSTKGRKACPHCMDQTESEWLKRSHKFCYLGHRRFLPINHRFRRLKAAFNGRREDRVAPKQLSGTQCLAELSKHTFKCGKPVKLAVGQRRRSRNNRQANRDKIQWKRKSIFFKLPYWEHLLHRDNLDVMHIEKNISDSILGTLLDVKGKTKDGINARADLEMMKIREKQHPRREGSKTFLPPAPFTTSKDEKILLCEVFDYVRAPDGYSANLSRCVKMDEKKLCGLKSHDHHVIMQQLLAIAVRHILPKATKLVLLEVSAIFRKLCSKKLSPASLELLKMRAALVLCQMEKIFPPFFDVMVHLLVHLPEEAAIAGPVQFRWMYPIERYLCTLKKYVRNRSRPEGSIAEGYIVDEALSFCSMYLDDVKTRRNRPSRNADSIGRGVDGGLSIFASLGHSKGKKKKIKLDQKTWEQCRRTVLFNCNECQPYLQECLDEVKQNNSRRRTIRELENIRNKIFPTWFKKRVNDLYKAHDPLISEDLRWLANGPRKTITSYNNHVVNGFRFRVKSIDDRKKNQNCGVFYTAATPCYSSARDPNPQLRDVDYYSVIKEIYELHYGGPVADGDRGRKVVLFNCEWVDSTRERGKKKDQYGFTLVNFNATLNTEDTFVLASSAIQAFYVKDPVDPNWHVAGITQPRDFYDVDAENDVSVNLENPLNATDHYATVELDEQFMDSEEFDTRLDVDGTHVDEVLPDPIVMMQLETSEDDFSSEDEDDDLYDDMEY